MRADHDVVVAGAGPAGLMLACELRLGGARVLVVERLTDVDGTIKAGSINTPTAEAFYRRGLLPRLAEVQQRTLEKVSALLGAAPGAGPGAPPPALPPKFAGHFAGIGLRADRFDPSAPGFADRGPAGDVGFVAQQDIERILNARAEELGVEVRRGVELTGFTADADGVTVTTRPGGTVRAGWLVGCDGGRSTVRKLAGFAFPGTDAEITGYQALVEMTGHEGLGRGWNWTETGTYAHGPTPGRILTVEFDGPPADRRAPVTAEELQKSLRRVSGVDVTITHVHTATRFTDNARQAADYRSGRVLLAGDAAHVHAPFGGQGLNLGVGDAMNLGWKLAAVVRGDAPETLLDSYTTERHPLGAWVLDWTRAQVSLMRPDPKTRALRALMAGLTEETAVTTHLATMISGVWQHYEAPAGAHPLVGHSAPDLCLADGSRLAGHLHDGRALLLDLTGDAVPAGRTTGDAAGYGNRLKVLTTTCAGHPELTALLVRPDGITAWAAGPDGATGSLSEALMQWLGAPAAG
ncbi:FAD-dependent oxidoreductase [Streptomyces mashuensis]|uniref:FAD-dependent oxidoreductase n=1 Tax=Streptomyces mashuensis TaxID=33904 RepID=A0A919BAF5_9ACTN|nr:FAD-dependent monooxygenase [Streptomyces mashuensis]GHF73176.1 FAD-dependent oxidoreductase [Streptomyces mashuensis]